MTDSAEIIERAVNDFQKIQRHMKIAKKENAAETYESLKEDYISLKVVIYKLKVQSL